MKNFFINAGLNILLFVFVFLFAFVFSASFLNIFVSFGRLPLATAFWIALGVSALAGVAFTVYIHLRDRTDA